MGAALLSWALITIVGGILQQAVGPSLLRRANKRAEREKAARIAAELEVRIARRKLARTIAQTMPRPPHLDRPYLGPRKR